MRPFTKLVLLFAVLALGLSPAAYADKDKDRDKQPNTAEQEARLRAAARSASAAIEPGSCRLGSAEKDLDVNNVQARLYNTGNLFWDGGDPVYYVPKESQLTPMFTSGVWVGGKVNDELRMAGSRYDNYEFWPGPLNDDGSLPNPNDCSEFDRLYKVSKTDIAAYEATGVASPDLADWPVELGAPVVDGDGVEGNYNLAGGDRPGILGDQSIWWVMNDVGNVHLETETPPMGMEVQVLAFAFSRADALNDITFYKYTLIYKGEEPLEETYIAVFSDADLGAEYTDDYIGSDLDLGLGFIYNADNEDVGGYEVPPALGIDFFQGPITDQDGDGDLDTLGTSYFTFYNNGGGATGDPTTGDEYYNYMSGFWADGQPFTFGGTARGGDVTTPFVFTGQVAPEPQYWSEFCLDEGCSESNSPDDRRFVISSGPFTMQPGERQEIFFAIVWAQGSDNINSVAALKSADDLAQTAFDIDFELPSPPDAPRISATSLDNKVALKWEYLPTDNNFLGSYDLVDPLLAGQLGVEDSTYTFEGFNVYRYPTSNFSDADRQLIATYDVVNGVTTVIDQQLDPETGQQVPFVAARGSDSGIRYFYLAEGLTNYRDYYYGISAYAVNDESIPKVLESPVNKITVRPAPVTALQGGSIAADLDTLDAFVGGLTAGTGEGIITGQVFDPTALMGATYQVRFEQIVPAECEAGEGERAATRGLSRVAGTALTADEPDGAAVSSRLLGDEEECEAILVYDIVNATTGEILLDGSDYLNCTGAFEGGFGGCGEAPPFGTDIFTAEGISFTITSPDAGIKGDIVAEDSDTGLAISDGGGIIEVAYGGDDVSPCGPDAESTDGCEEFGGNTVWLSPNSTDDYYVTISGGSDPATAIFDRFYRYIETFVPNDAEIRFTEECMDETPCYGIAGFTSQTVYAVPFELWFIGPGTPDDPSDDVRLIPFIFPSGDDDGTFNFTSGTDFFNGGPASDVFYGMYPDLEAGGYDAFAAAAAAVGVGNAPPDDEPLDDGVENISPATGEPCSNQGNFALYCYRNDELTGSYPGGGFGASFVYPVGRLQIATLDESAVPPPPGTVIRLLTAKPIRAGDVYEFDTSPAAFQPDAVDPEEVLDLIAAVPNPYRGASLYETGGLDKVIRFVNLPERSTIRIFTLSGTLIYTIPDTGTNPSVDWNLETEDGLPIASGMYLVHVETDLGEKVIKLGVVNRKAQFDFL